MTQAMQDAITKRSQLIADFSNATSADEMLEINRQIMDLDALVQAVATNVN